MDYKVSYIQQWHPTEGTHYTQQVRLSATDEELASYGIHLEPGINYTHLDEFAYIVGRLGIHTDPRILFNRNSVILYQPETNYLVDRDGKPYIQDESWPAGGGLDRRCDYNKEALQAFDSKDYDRILEENGFELVYDSGYCVEAWEKGNTKIVFEDRIDGLWGYVHTEFITK